MRSEIDGLLATIDSHTTPPLSGPATLIPPRAERAHPSLHPDALYGLAGRVVAAIRPTTESDDVAILVTILSCVGSAIGRNPSMHSGENRHGSNFFAAVVGKTGSGKGASLAPVMGIMKEADTDWYARHVSYGGIQSGEGIINLVRDADAKKGDDGVADKRMLVIEEEMSHVFKTGSRQGSTVSQTLRRAYDGRTLENTSASFSRIATDPHISFLGHITQEELLSLITNTDVAGGLANRFMWLCVRRSKVLPNPPRLPMAKLSHLASEIRTCIEVGSNLHDLQFTDEAQRLWATEYPLFGQSEGMVGKLTARDRDIVKRLCVIYAILDQSVSVHLPHLQAALAMWRYAEESVRYIFGEMTGDTLKDKILEILSDSGGWVSKTDLNKELNGHSRARDIDPAIESLHRGGQLLVSKWKSPGNRGPATTFYALNAPAPGNSPQLSAGVSLNGDPSSAEADDPWLEIESTMLDGDFLQGGLATV